MSSQQEEERGGLVGVVAGLKLPPRSATKLLTWTWGHTPKLLAWWGHKPSEKHLRIFYRGDCIVVLWRSPNGWIILSERLFLVGEAIEFVRCIIGEKLAKEFAGVSR